MTDVIRYTPEQLIAAYKPTSPPSDIENFGPVKYTGNFQPLSYNKSPKKRFKYESGDYSNTPIPAYYPGKQNRFAQSSTSPPPRYIPKYNRNFGQNKDVSEPEYNEPVFSFGHVIDQGTSGSDYADFETFRKYNPRTYDNTPQQQRPYPNQQYQAPTIFNPTMGPPGFTPDQNQYYNPQYMDQSMDNQMYANASTFQQYQLMQQFALFQQMQRQSDMNQMEQYQQFQQMYNTMINFQQFQQFQQMMNYQQYPPGFASSYQQPQQQPPPQQQNYHAPQQQPSYVQQQTQTYPQNHYSNPKPIQEPVYNPNKYQPKQFQPYVPPQKQNSPPKKEPVYQNDESYSEYYSDYYSDEESEEEIVVYASVTKQIPEFSPQRRESKPIELPPPITKHPPYEKERKYSIPEKYAPYYPNKQKN